MLIDAQTRLLALLGHPVNHSLSPRMHNAALAHLGLKAVYIAFAPPPSRVPEAVRGLLALGCGGWNVTAPYKRVCAELADVLKGPAEALGTVNTMLHDGSRLVGYNTDVGGLRRAWKEHQVEEGQHLMVLGRGGAARAVVWAACQLGLSVTVAARSPIDDLLVAVRKHFIRAETTWCPWPERQGKASSVQIVVNATPMDSPLDADCLSPHQLVCDLVYGHEPTSWLRAAGNRGCKVMDGRELLLYQGAEAFSLFTGHEAPMAVMRGALYGGACDVTLSHSR